MTDIRAGVPAAWKPIAWTDEVQAEMDKEHPDVPWLRRWMLDNYAAQSGDQIQLEDATPAQLTKLVHWLAFQEANDGAGTLRRRWRRLDHVLYSNYSLKITMISQRHCFICDGGAAYRRSSSRRYVCGSHHAYLAAGVQIEARNV